MTGDSNRLGDAVALLMEAAERFQAIGIAPETMKRIDDFIATIHPAECVELPEETPTAWKAIGWVDTIKGEPFAKWEPGREPKHGELLYRPVHQSRSPQERE